jgi:hypothetical protein
MIMDYLDGFVVETEKARDTALTVFNNFTAILKGMREQLARAAEELDKQQRLGAAMRARNQSEQERANKELAEANAELAKVRKTIESERKEWSREKAAVRAAFDDILAKTKVA